MLRPASFLDRDGVINVEKGYVYKIQDFEWIDGAREAIKLLNEKSYYVIVVTNQSGIARNYYKEKDVERLHKFINIELKKINAHIDKFFYSPYHPNFSNEYSHLAHLRKPNIGMLKEAEKNLKFDKKKSFMIGDQDSDIMCAKNYGIQGYKFNSDNLYDFICNILNT
tara:strand:+ start:191 stop:691 length:501 start_codon:yes stop_codon:yes gene_type:complete